MSTWHLKNHQLNMIHQKLSEQDFEKKIEALGYGVVKEKGV